ncbi:23S rRNA (uracil(1939)-C(5))-methyltransferase RlmD [Dielma fastidiosa]|nr:23S rRNA (uracil(1939)-C(5))-methyltransferase RlmD [Dielma fastidiosa]
MMKKNDRVTGTCLNYTFEGLGVVKVDGFPLFVKDMLVGECGEIVVTQVRKNFGYGRLMKLISASPERAEPPCKIFKQCGGCQLQHFSLAELQRFKTQRVKDALERIGGLDCHVEDALMMEDGWYYRNKGQVPVGVDKAGKTVCGFYRINSNDIIDMDVCLIQHELINKTVQCMKRLIGEFGNAEVFRHLLVKVGFSTREIMVVFIVREKRVAELKKMASMLVAEVPEVKSVILNLNQRADNVILGDEEELLYGRPTIVDELDGLCFEISSKSFYQVNPVQTVKLYNQAVAFAELSKDDRVVDLYCGIGTITQFMARQAAHVQGVEVVAAAIEDAKRNAARNGIVNVDFVCADAGEYAARIADSGERVDVVCVDPPRKGCDERTLEAMLTMAPRRIVYVSCDPSTLARDLKYLGERGYGVERVQPVDMFPWTYHVETVVLLSKLITKKHVNIELHADELDLTSSKSK